MKKRLLAAADELPSRAPPAAASAPALSAGAALQAITVVLLGIIAVELAVVTPKVLKVASFVEEHEDQLTAASSFIDSVQGARESMPRLLEGSLPRLVTTVLTSDWSSTAQSVTRFLKGMSEATRIEVPDTSAQEAMDDVAKYSALVASIAVKLMEISNPGPPTEHAGAMEEEMAPWPEPEPPWPEPNGDDGGLALGFLNDITALAVSQLNPLEWHAAASSCIELVHRLEQKDWLGYYYCGSRSDGCEWDINEEMQSEILPAAMDICDAVRSLSLLPGTPSECAIAVDGKCGSAKSEGGENECLQCVSTHLADLERLGCTLDQGREYCVGQLYRCVNSGGSLQCVVDESGSGLPLEQCEAVCGVDEPEWR